MKNLKITAVLALIGAALALQGAKAQIVPAAAPGDLIFGAENINSTGTATGNDDEVDLGSITNFTTTATLTFSNVSSTDIAAALGSNLSNAFYSVAGTTGGSVVGGYDEKSVFITGTSAPSASSFNGLSINSGDVVSVYNGLNQSTGFTAGSNGSTGIIQIGSGNSYSEEEGTNNAGTTPFNFGIADNASLLSGAQLDLYAVSTAYTGGTANKNTIGSVTELGSFTYSNNVLTFTGSAAAVPEPSAYVLAFLAAGLFVVLRRRQALNS